MRKLAGGWIVGDFASIGLQMFAEELRVQLAQRGYKELGEVALREVLEAHCETYTLIKLAPWPARRWKCRYRLMIGDNMYDAQSAAEAYAMGLLGVLESLHG